MPSQPSDQVQKLLASAQRAISSNKLNEAARICAVLTQDYPAVAEGWFASSVVSLRVGSFNDAIRTIERALGASPDRHDWQLHRAYCLMAAGRVGDTVDAVEKLSRVAGPDWQFLANLAMLAGRIPNYHLAADLYRRAITLAPDNPRLHYNRAAVQRFLGTIADAVESCRKCLQLNPLDSDALLLQSDLQVATASSNNVSALRHALAQGLEAPLARAQVHFALAKELEELGRFAESFEVLSEGAAMRRATFDYDVAEDVAFIEAISETYDKQSVGPTDVGCKNAEPIFVVGLPRTGTTLVERILGSHSTVQAAGELTHFTHAITRELGRLADGRNLSRPEMVSLTREINFAQLGRGYIESTRPMTGSSLHFVDKFPQNALYLGLIRLALPEAKVVLLERHPMDTCYSMYKQLFTDIYHFSYDLSELGRYYLAYRKLMDHWTRSMPAFVYKIRYEDLVHDMEVQVNGLLEYCGLEWEDACLRFHENRQATTTASATQVRKQVYQTSVGRWLKYERQLAPLRQILESGGICLDRETR